MPSEVLDRIFKAYDIRGLVDEEITEDIAFAIGSSFALFLMKEREPATVVIGEDMRPSSPLLAEAFADGVNSQGFDAIRIGLCSTDGLYFASGKLNLPGAMFTASHNPAAYNGIKLCKSQARPIGQESGLARIKAQVIEGAPLPHRALGKVSTRNLLDDYVDYLFSLFKSEAFSGSFAGRQLTIGVDAGNGMGGYTAPAVLSRVNAKVESLYFDLDGTFPNHEANPIDAKNMVDLQELVLSKKCDIGLAFDGDADRCFIVDERGELVSPSAMTALIASRELALHPDSAVIYNLICSQAVPEIIRESGGKPIRSRVGHSFIKGLMADHDAIFGGEHSGHFYFKNFWRADSGMLAALHVIAALLENGQPLSELIAPFNRYHLSGEINTKVADTSESIAKVRTHFASLPSIELDELDGLTVINTAAGEAWRFNLRPSNTEPLLRLNAEARDAGQMKAISSQVLDLLKSQ